MNLDAKYNSDFWSACYRSTPFSTFLLYEYDSETVWVQFRVRSLSGEGFVSTPVEPYTVCQWGDEAAFFLFDGRKVYIDLFMMKRGI